MWLLVAVGSISPSEPSHTSAAPLSSPGHEGCLTPPGHVAPPLFMGALEERENFVGCFAPNSMIVHITPEYARRF